MNSDDPLISIIIPVYNSEEVILRTLESVHKQTYTNYEVIIINDGSTDNTRRIIRDSVSMFPKLIIHDQENGGVSAARNKGISIANGEFISFLDSDDTYHPQFLEKLLRRQIETGSDAVYCGYQKIGWPTPNHLTLNFAEGKILSSYLLGDNFFHFSCMLIKKELLIKNNIDFEIGRMSTEDILFTIKILNVSIVSAVKEKLYNYFYRNNSATNIPWNKQQWLSEIGGLKRIKNYLVQNYYDEERAKVIEIFERITLTKEIEYLGQYLLMWKYKEIKKYLINNDLRRYEMIVNKNYLSRATRKKFSILRRTNSFIWLLGTLYYKYLRFNFRCFK